MCRAGTLAKTSTFVQFKSKGLDAVSLSAPVVDGHDVVAPAGSRAQAVVDSKPKVRPWLHEAVVLMLQ